MQDGDLPQERAPVGEALDEAERLADLEGYRLLDTPAEAAYDEITRIAAHICGTPISLVSLVDRDRQWFKSKQGLAAPETPRDVAFCAHAIQRPEVLQVVDARLDERFRDNPLVQGDPNIRFYAGAPLETPAGFRAGTLCVIDRRPRRLSDAQLEMLAALSRQVVALMELRKSLAASRAQGAALKQRSALLERSNASLKQFSYAASHDLQEPIRMVASYTGLIRSRYASVLDAKGQHYLTYVQDGADRMQRLVDGLLRFAHADTVPLRVREVVAADALQEALENLTVLLNERSAIVENGDLPNVLADPSLLTLIFQNLVGNAVKFCDTAPRIRVSAVREPSRWVFSVEDNGIGIRPEHQERIFGIFSRLHSRTEYAGTGLGLTLAQAIVQRHGGNIWLESVVGQGSTFYFSLPVETDDA